MLCRILGCLCLIDVVCFLVLMLLLVVLIL